MAKHVELFKHFPNWMLFPPADSEPFVRRDVITITNAVPVAGKTKYAEVKVEGNQIAVVQYCHVLAWQLEDYTVYAVGQKYHPLASPTMQEKMLWRLFGIDPSPQWREGSTGRQISALGRFDRSTGFGPVVGQQGVNVGIEFESLGFSNGLAIAPDGGYLEFELRGYIINP